MFTVIILIIIGCIAWFLISTGIHNYRQEKEYDREKSTSTKTTLEQELDDILEKHHLQ